MKVYCVFFLDVQSQEYALNKVFASEKKAKQYVMHMNAISDFEWMSVETVVEE